MITKVTGAYLNAAPDPVARSSTKSRLTMESKTAKLIEIFIAVVALVVATFALKEAYQSNSLSSKANSIATDANGLSRQANYTSQQANGYSRDSVALLRSAERRQVALRVFIGEAPLQREKAFAIWAVTNASPIDVTHAWVEGKLRTGQDFAIDVESIQRCSVYLLNKTAGEFDPLTLRLHFYDGTYYWERDFSGLLRPDNERTMSVGVRQIKPAAAFPVTGFCGG
jgi:hypothetical protein